MYVPAYSIVYNIKSAYSVYVVARGIVRSVPIPNYTIVCIEPLLFCRILHIVHVPTCVRCVHVPTYRIDFIKLVLLRTLCSRIYLQYSFYLSSITL